MGRFKPGRAAGNPELNLWTKISRAHTRGYGATLGRIIDNLLTDNQHTRGQYDLKFPGKTDGKVMVVTDKETFNAYVIGFQPNLRLRVLDEFGQVGEFDLVDVLLPMRRIERPHYE